jgi:hypothetical protein
VDPFNADLETLISAADSLADETKSAFGPLSPSQLNWKPSANRWSVAQCFDHLLTTNQGYFPVIDDVLAGKKRVFWERVPLLPKLAGRFFIKVLDPASTRKLRAPKGFQPTQSDIPKSVIGEFIDQQQQLMEKMRASEHLALEKIVITSPIAAVITYSLMDAYRIIVVHQQRHFLQAKRVTQDQAFPA